MGYKRAVIDSLCLSSESFEELFTSNDYIIESIKTFEAFEPKWWKIEFGKPLNKWIKEAKIIYTSTGLAIPLIRHSRSPDKQRIDFAGLHGYDERSEFLNQVLRHKWSQLQDAEINRYDVAIDYFGDLPDRVKRALRKLDRILFQYGNTSYYKTPKEKKINQYVGIKVYDKRHEAGLDFDCMRIEFSFRGSFFKGLQLKDLDEAKEKMGKYIKKKLGLTVKIKCENIV